MVGFSQQTYSINEEDESGDGSVVEVCLALTSGNLERSIAVFVSIIDGSSAGILHATDKDKKSLM